MHYNLEQIGERIAKERKTLKLSQADLIDKLNDNGVAIGRTTLSMIEGGKSTGSLTLEVLDGLCVVFGCEIGYLLGEPGYANKTKHTTNVTEETGLSKKAIETLKEYMATDELNSVRKLQSNQDFEPTILIPLINCLLENTKFTSFLYDLVCFSETEQGDRNYSEMIGTMFLDLGKLSDIVKNDYEEAINRYLPSLTERIERNQSQLEETVRKEREAFENLDMTRLEDAILFLTQFGFTKDVAKEEAKDFVVKPLSGDYYSASEGSSFVSDAFVHMVRSIIDRRTQTYLGNNVPKANKSEATPEGKDSTKKKLNVVFRSANSQTIKDLPKSLKKKQ